MADRSLGRRDVLKAGAGTALAAAAGTARVEAQAGSAAPATPVARPADLVLTNGKIITVDRAFTIADSITIAGDRIAAVGRGRRWRRSPLRRPASSTSRARR
jgi:hypothetical protein